MSGKQGNQAWTVKKVGSKRLDVLNAALKTGHRRRWPVFVLLSSGLFLLRVAQRTFAGLLFQLPPRSTRNDAPFRLWYPKIDIRTKTL
jgi:hypothetical protein